MSINGNTKATGIIGYPVEHTKSPLIHNYWFEKHNINGVYIPLCVKPSDFADVIKNISKLGFKGLNITIPHKIQAMELVDVLTKDAQNAGAVNTIIFKNGILEGHNTDIEGFTESIEQKCPDQFIKGPAVLYGAGGAARAICSSLVNSKCPEIRLVNRTISNAENLADIMNSNKIKIFSWDNRSECIDNASLLINATSIGMERGDDLPVDLSKLNSKAVVFDIIYNSIKTKFLRRAAVRGNIVIDGFQMLLNQARLSFNSWFDTMPEITEELYSLVIK